MTNKIKQQTKEELKKAVKNCEIQALRYYEKENIENAFSDLWEFLKNKDLI